MCTSHFIILYALLESYCFTLSIIVCINYHYLYIENKLKYNNNFISRDNICESR